MTLVLAVVVGIVAWRRTVSEPRRLTNAAWIIAAFLLGLHGLATVGMGGPFAVTLLVAAISPVLALGLGVFLIVNGIQMWRRESRSLANSLSLIGGVALIGALAVALVALAIGGELVFAPALWLLLATGWAGLLFFAYVGYASLYQRLVARRTPQFVIVLGAGLRGGRRVGPLLAGRIDKAREVCADAAARGTSPVLVMSGGQGPDEQVSEAQAMSDYAVEAGVDPAVVVREDRSRNTVQNLRFSHELVAADPRIGPSAAGVAVTSNYHAMRAAMLARSLGLPIDAIGAPTAFYYWPSATLREFVAILRDNLVWNVVAFVLVTVPLPLIFAFVV